MTVPLAYRRAEYELVPAWRRWWPLAVQEAGLLFRSRWGQAVMFACLLPVVVRLVMLLIVFGVLQFGPRDMRPLAEGRPRGIGVFNPLEIGFYVDPVLDAVPGMLCVLLLSALIPARAIARDRMTNALELYWTRGISPLSYLLAKWIGSALLIGIVTVAGPCVLWLVAVCLNEDWQLFTTTCLPMLQALGGLVVATLVWTGMAVLLSASCASANAAMVLWTMLLVGSAAIGVVAQEATHSESLFTVLSVWEAVALVARWVGDLAPRGAPIRGSCTTVGVLLLLFALRARRHLRVTEALQ